LPFWELTDIINEISRTDAIRILFIQMILRLNLEIKFPALFMGYKNAKVDETCVKSC